VDVKRARAILIHALDEAEVPLVTMAVGAFGEHPAVGDVQSSKERGCAVALVIMRHPLVDIA